MRRIVRSAALAAALITGAACFERGGKVSRDDAGVALVAIDAAPAAIRRAVDPTGAARADATITLSVAAEPAHLNPLVASDAVTGRIAMGEIYEGLLCTPGPVSSAEPCLGTVAQSGKGEWRFDLRRDVRWHDGKPFTAADVTFTFGLVKNPKVASWLAADFDDLVSVRASGSHQVTFRFSKRRVDRTMAFSRVPILPRHLHAPAKDLRTQKPIGTGPLRFEEWKRGQRITLSRNPSYWGKPAGAARVVYRVIATRQRALLALGRGELDLVLQIPVDEALRATANSNLAVFGYRLPAYLAAVHNHRHPALSDARVRRGLTMTLDRPALVREVFKGFADLVSGPFLLGHASYDSTIAPLPFRPKAGARAIAEATGGKRLSVKVMVPQGSRTMGRIADIWAADAKPHVDITVQTVPFAEMLARLRRGDFEIALMGFTTHRDIDLYTRFHSSQVGVSNYGALRDKALDELLEAVRAATSTDKRNALQRRVHKRVHELQTYTFIASDTRVGLARVGVGGVTGDAAGLRASQLWRAR